MEQTAVEWLEFEINRRGPKEDNPPQWLKELYEQAKEMEKEQHQETWFESTTQFDNAAEMTYRKEFEQYYKETFKSE